MVTFKNIVVPTDFSKDAREAVPLAAQLARSFGASLQLLHVLDVALYVTGTAVDAFAVLSATPAGWVESKMSAEKKILSDLAATYSEAEKLTFTPVLRKGSPANTIVEFAAEQENACIVIATHGHSALYHMLIGSVAERVVRLSSCPVFSVRPKPSDQKIQGSK